MTTSNQRWAAVAFFLAGLAAAGQPVPGPGSGSSPAAPTNQVPAQGVITNQGQTVPTTGTNELETPSIPAQSGVLPSMSDMTGPTAPGSGVIGSPLMGTKSFGGPSFFGGANGPSAPGLLRWGPVDVHPFAQYAFLSESGIGSQPGQHNGTTANTISEGLAINLGKHWSLNYGASSAFYSGSGYADTTSQFASLSGSVPYKDWQFFLSETYSESSQPLLETGTQTTQEGYGSALVVSRQLGSKLSLNVGANQSYRSSSQFNDVDTWYGSLGLN